MDSWRRRLGRAGRALASALDRLTATLAELRGRLREAVTRTVGDAVADAARDALHAVLADDPDHWRSADGYPASRYRRNSGWHDPDADWRPWPGQPEPKPSENDDFESGTTKHRPGRWAAAIATGCRAVAAWLGRPGRHPALAALGVGLAATLSVGVVGRFAGTAAGLAGAALGLLEVADATRRAADALSD